MVKKYVQSQSQLQNLSKIKTSLILRKKPRFRCLHLRPHFFNLCSRLMTVDENKPLSKYRQVLRVFGSAPRTIKV